AAMYLQRYALKNDFIGFFGPCGWGQLTDDGPAMVVEPGPHLVSHRVVRFEHWAVMALIERFRSDEPLRATQSPRLHPMVRVEDGVLHHGGRPVPLPDEYRRLLERCDARTPANHIADELAADPTLGIEREEVLAMLDELAGKRVVLWNLDIPMVPNDS